MKDDIVAPQPVDAGPHAVGFRAFVPASPEEVWALVANPHRHHEFDGSGTVKSQAIGPHELTEGTKFSVHMRKFGVPYRLPLRVTRAERNRTVEWRQPTGHRWRWEIEPAEGGVIVTETFDTSRQLPPARAALKAAGVLKENAANMQASLVRMRGLFPEGI
ncbi:SRPBCC family protein [Nesterenkonia populi]